MSVMWTRAALCNAVSWNFTEFTLAPAGGSDDFKQMVNVCTLIALFYKLSIQSTVHVPICSHALSHTDGVPNPPGALRKVQCGHFGPQLPSACDFGVYGDIAAQMS